MVELNYHQEQGSWFQVQGGKWGEPELTSSLWHQNHNYVQNSHLWEWPEDQWNRFPTTKGIKRTTLTWRHFHENTAQLSFLQSSSCLPKAGQPHSAPAYSSVSVTVEAGPHSLATSAPGCSQTHQPATPGVLPSYTPAYLQQCGQALQPAGSGSRLTSQCIHSSCGPTTRGDHTSPHSGHFWSIWFWWLGGTAPQGPIGHLPCRSHFQDQEM